MDYAMIEILEILKKRADRDGKVTLWRVWDKFNDLSIPDGKVEEVLDDLRRIGSIEESSSEDGYGVRLLKTGIEFV